MNVNFTLFIPIHQFYFLALKWIIAVHKEVLLFLLCLFPFLGAQAHQEMVLNGIKVATTPQESQLLQINTQNSERIITFTDSEQIDISDDNNKITLTGGAQIRRPDGILKGDTITYNRKTGDVNAIGNARMLRDGSLVTGSELNYNVATKTGTIANTRYRIANSGSGQADYAELVDDNHTHLENARYAACDCDDKIWYIKAKQVDLYNDENEGIAKDGVLYIKGVPVFWSPYLTFPIKQERKTGWITPMYQATSRSGFGLTFPFFWNMAPHYDLTLYPQYYSKRGFMLGAEFRYITPNYRGTFQGTYMPKDTKSKDKRWSFNWQHSQKLGALAGLDFSLNIDVAGVNDTNYYRDFSELDLNKSTRTSLSKSAQLSFSGYNYWSGYLQVQKYQPLHDLTATDPSKYIYYDQYEKVPEFMLQATRYDWHGIDINFTNTITRFVYPKNKLRRGGYGEHMAPDGVRYVSYTQLSYPIVRPGWYIRPKIGLHASYYSTEWYSQHNSGLRSQAHTQYRHLSRVLPILSIDAGMTFERKTSLFGKASIQTLEPRLYYVYIPYKNQANIPVFDTGLSHFGFGTAFSENRYTGGWDRINDANRLTVGLTSRWYDEHSGKERMVLQLAQRFQFRKPKVTLDNGRDRYLENSRSEFFANLSVDLTDKFSTELGAQFDTYNKKMVQTYAAIRFFPKRLASFSLTYRYQKEPYKYFVDGGSTLQTYTNQLKGRETIGVAMQWPVTNKLYFVGYHDYSIREKRSTQTIVGLEYKDKCCVVTRFVFQRYAVAKDKLNSALFFQVEFNGLGAVGSDPMEVLKKSIPGYQYIKDPKPVQSPFERYE